MFNSDVFPQPLGPTIAMNSPSATETETSESASTAVALRSVQYRFERWSISSLTMGPSLPEGFLGFPFFFGFDAGPKQFFEIAFLYEAVHDAVVDDSMEVEIAN